MENYCHYNAKTGRCNHPTHRRLVDCSECPLMLALEAIQEDYQDDDELLNMEF